MNKNMLVFAHMNKNFHLNLYLFSLYDILPMRCDFQYAERDEIIVLLNVVDDLKKRLYRNNIFVVYFLGNLKTFAVFIYLVQNIFS